MNIYTFITIITAVITLTHQTHLRNNAQSVDIELIRDRTSLIMNIGLGTPTQYFRTMLDISSNHLWVGNTTLTKSLPRVFYTEQSSSFEHHQSSTHIFTVNQEGEEVSDYITLGDNPVVSSDKKFNFVLLNKLNTYSRNEAVLGLAREYPGKIKFGKGTAIEGNPRFSLLQYLYTTQAISQKQFSLKFFNNDKAVLTLGQSKDSLNGLPKCTPNQRVKNSYMFHKWNCAYNGVYFDNGTSIFEFNADELQTAIFETVIDYVQLPRKQGKAVLTKINEVLNNECNIFTDSNKGTGLECSSNVDVDKAPTLIVKLNGFDFKLPGKELFESSAISGKEGHVGYVCKIFGSKFNKESIRIGYAFMKYYELHFNMDEGSVSFGEFNDVFERTVVDIRGGSHYGMNDGVSFWKALCYVLIGVLVTFVCVVLYKKRGMRKKFGLRIIKKEKKGVNDNKAQASEKFIEPIGKPMLDK